MLKFKYLNFIAYIISFCIKNMVVYFAVFTNPLVISTVQIAVYRENVIRMIPKKCTFIQKSSVLLRNVLHLILFKYDMFSQCIYIYSRIH